MAHTRTSSKTRLEERSSAPASEAVEDYVKSIYALERHGEGPITTSALAERLDVAPSSVTAMLKRLDEAGLVRYEPYPGVGLTRRGEQLGLEGVRPHPLIEGFLAQSPGVARGPGPDQAGGLQDHIS